MHLKMYKFFKSKKPKIDFLNTMLELGNNGVKSRAVRHYEDDDDDGYMLSCLGD